MKTQKIYEHDDKMINLIKDNYNILQSLSSFGISLGFGDKTVRQICEAEGVDTFTFLTIINFAINNYRDFSDYDRLCIPTLLRYLKASHNYYLGFQMPFIRRELSESIDPNSHLGALIIKVYDEYTNEIRQHMGYEEKILFPYVEALLGSDTLPKGYNIETFAENHHEAAPLLKALKLLIIKYMPSDAQRSNQLLAALHAIYNNEEWLERHAQVENLLFTPAIRLLEQARSSNDVAKRISQMVETDSDTDALSDREREIIVALVQGMANKEIADHLNISVHTVTTHRRNITRKLGIHSSAGLTIYAIVHGLVDISSVEL